MRGASLAIELTRRGVETRLIDRNPEPLGWDRATVIKPRSLELLDTLGLAEAFIELGAVIPGARFFLHGEAVAAVGFDDLDSRFNHLLSLPESETERILTAKLEQHGGVVERGLELVGLEQAAGHVVGKLRRISTGEEARQRASWLVGTDGFHRAVREAVDDPFEGHDNPLLWAVVDGRLRGWKHDPNLIAVQLERPAVNPVPIGQGRWRIYFRPEAVGTGALESVAEGLSTMSLGATLVDHDEPRFFRTHSRIAKTYRVGRVLLAGDAAHVCSPIQGHGMNVGIQDAHNLAWKLALVVHGNASADLLDSYEAERRPIARAIVASGDEAEKRFGGNPGDIEAAVKGLTDTVGIRRAASAEAELAHCYPDSSILLDRGWDTGESEDVTRVGCRVGDVEELKSSGGGLRFHELLRKPGHKLFVVTGTDDKTDIESAVRFVPTAVARYRDHLDGYVVTTSDATVDSNFPGLITDPNRRLGRRLTGDRGGLCVVRPDGYLGFRGPDLSLDQLGDYMGLMLFHAN